MTKSHAMRRRVRAYREAQKQGKWARDPRFKLPWKLTPAVERLIQSAIDRHCKGS